MFAILLSVLNLPAALQGQLKPPPDKADEIRRFHTPEVRGMAAAERLKGYVQRQALIRETPYSQIKWRCVGPELQSGRVVSVDSPHDLPQRLLVGFATGGLWQTDDDGITWTSLFDDQSSFGIGDVAVSRDGQTIWVGTGEANSQRTSYAGTGVFKSTDAGKTWTNMGLEETQHIGKVLIDPRNENTVYVAAIGHLYSQNPERGVYKTTDGGKSWQHVLKIDARTGVIDIVQPYGGDRHRSGSSSPGHALCVGVGPRPKSLELQGIRPGQRALQVDRCGPNVEEARRLPFGTLHGANGTRDQSLEPFDFVCLRR